MMIEKMTSNNNSTPILKLLNVSLFCIFVFIVIAVGYIQYSINTNAELIAGASIWDKSKTCHIAAYGKSYRRFGIIGRVIGLFSSRYIFRVYTSEGRLLKSSVWGFSTISEFSDTPLWAGTNAVYPTDKGYESWRIPECND